MHWGGIEQRIRDKISHKYHENCHDQDDMCRDGYDKDGFDRRGYDRNGDLTQKK